MSFSIILNKLLNIKKSSPGSGLEELEAIVQKDYGQTGLDLLNKIFFALGFKKEAPDICLDVAPYPPSERYGTSYNHSVYQKLLPLCQLAYLSEQNGIAEEHAFKLATIFDKEQGALSYLLNRARNIMPSDKNAALSKESVVHDGCLFDLPSPDSCNFKEWQQLARKNLENPRFRELFPHAGELEKIARLTLKKRKAITPDEKKQETEHSSLFLQMKKDLSLLIKQYKDLDTNPVTQLTPQELIQRQENLSLWGKKIGEQRRALTKFCQGLPFSQMNMIVLQAFYESYQHGSNEGHKILVNNGITSQNIDKFNQLPRTKAEDFIPEVLLDGQSLGYPEFYLKKLDTSSNEGAAMAACLGKITHCCQYLGGVGEQCAIHGITSPNGGFYVVCKGNSKNPSLEDPVIAQSWVWRGQNKGLCLDSVEVVRSLKEAEYPMITDFFRMLGHTLCQKYAISRVNTGAQSGITRHIALKNCHTQKEHFLDYHGYCDSKSQLPLANQSMPYLFYGQTNSELLQTLITQETRLFFTTLFTTAEALKDNQILKQALAFALSQNEDLLNLLREAAIDTKRQEEFEVLLQINKEHRENLNQNKINIELIEQGADINMLNYKGESALHLAALNVDLALFEQLLAQHPNLNIQDRYGNTVLLRTLEKIVYEDKNEDGRYIVASLIEMKADLDIKDKDEVTPLMLAVKNNDLLLVKILCQQGADIETFDDDMKTALFLAVERGLTDIFDYLVKQGAQWNVISYKTRDNLLIAAVKGKSLTIVKAILADPQGFKMFQQENKYKEDALTWAIKNNQGSLFEELLAHPCCTTELLQKHGGIPAIFIKSVVDGYTEIVSAILKSSYGNSGLLLQLNKYGHKTSALVLAIESRHPEVVLAILASSCCTEEVLGHLPDVQNPLLEAIGYDYSEVVLAILNSSHFTEKVLELYGGIAVIFLDAVARNNIEIVQAILNSPYSNTKMMLRLNKQLNNPLESALTWDHPAMFSTILASPYCTDEVLGQIRDYSRNALTYAMQHCSSELVLKILVSSYCTNSVLAICGRESSVSAVARLIETMINHPYCTSRHLQRAFMLIYHLENRSDNNDIDIIDAMVQSILKHPQCNSEVFLHPNLLQTLLPHIYYSPHLEPLKIKMLQQLIANPYCTAEVLQQESMEYFHSKNILMYAIRNNLVVDVISAILKNPHCNSEMLQQTNINDSSILKIVVTNKMQNFGMDRDIDPEIIQAVLTSPHCTFEMLVKLQEDNTLDMNETARSLIPELIEKLKNESKVIENNQSMESVSNPHGFFNDPGITPDHSEPENVQRQDMMPGNSEGN